MESNDIHNKLINEYRFPDDDNPLKIPLGVTESGEVIGEDFKNVSNLIISGVTGSGKTSFVLAIMVELMEVNSPDKVRFMIYDSKKVDYILGIESPFLFMPIIHDDDTLFKKLEWVSKMIDQRLADNCVQKEYPDIFLIIDDYYSCYSKCKTILEEIIVKNRKARVHCIIVSSIFTPKTISNELLSNIDNRVLFHVTEKANSVFLLGEAGAEQLAKPREVFYKRMGKMDKCEVIKTDENAFSYNSTKYGKDYYFIQDYNEIKHLEKDSESVYNGYDELFEDAGRLVIEKDKASIGYLQRMFRIGFNRAAIIMDQLFEAGVVGDELGTKPRNIIMTLEEFEQMIKN